MFILFLMSISTSNEKKSLLDKYANIYIKFQTEGEGYYILYYTSEEEFTFDPKLKQAFANARTAIHAFRSLLKSRIEECGGDPKDYEE